MHPRQFINLAAGCIFVILAGCGKKEESKTEAAAQLPARQAKSALGAEKIPGEKELLSAMAEKNYSTAVERLFAMQPLLATDEQRDRWAELFGELRSQLSDASTKDPKAAEALVTLRSARNGR
jgi:hypothetical protein